MGGGNAAVVLLAAVLLLVQWPLGDLLGRTLTSRRHLAVERFAYRLVGVAPDAEQAWSAYAVAVVAFSGVGILLLYALFLTAGARCPNRWGCRESRQQAR